MNEVGCKGCRALLGDGAENGEWRLRRRSASDMSAGSEVGIAFELEAGGGGGMFIGSKTE